MCQKASKCDTTELVIMKTAFSNMHLVASPRDGDLQWHLLRISWAPPVVLTDGFVCSTMLRSVAAEPLQTHRYTRTCRTYMDTYQWDQWGCYIEAQRYRSGIYKPELLAFGYWRQHQTHSTPKLEQGHSGETLVCYYTAPSLGRLCGE